ncbi:MAG: ABC transporter substrate-binding protein [Eubacteriales bacterium]|nr:ABC transporter substrate-binding protein [Eubacteriales bacterium]
MKKLISLALAVVMCVACVFCFVSCSKSVDVELKDGAEITIGVYEPASGDNGAGGKQETLGVKYANSIKPTVTINGKEYKVKLAIVDNQSSNDKAKTAAAELINQNSIVVLGSYGSGVSIAASETFKEAGVPAIGITCTNPQVTEGNEHYFRVCFLDPFQGTVLANYAKDELGATKSYVMACQGSDYDVGLADYYKKAFGDSKCVYETFPQNTSDFTSYVQKAIDQSASVIFAPVSVNYAQLIVSKANDLGFKGTILAGDTWDSNKIVESATGKDLDIRVTTFYQEGANAEFDTGFQAWLNADAQRLSDNGGNTMVSAVSAMGYDAYMTALYAIEHAKVDGSKLTSVAVRDSLAAMKSADNAFKGVTGVIYFNDTGDAVRDTAYIKKIDTANGNWTFVKEQKAS